MRQLVKSMRRTPFVIRIIRRAETKIPHLARWHMPNRVISKPSIGIGKHKIQNGHRPPGERVQNLCDIFRPHQPQHRFKSRCRLRPYPAHRQHGLLAIIYRRHKLIDNRAATGSANHQHIRCGIAHGNRLFIHLKQTPCIAIPVQILILRRHIFHVQIAHRSRVIGHAPRRIARMPQINTRRPQKKRTHRIHTRRTHLRLIPLPAQIHIVVRIRCQHGFAIHCPLAPNHPIIAANPRIVSPHTRRFIRRNNGFF